MKMDLRALAGLVLVACAPNVMADGEEGGWWPALDGEVSVGWDSNLSRALYERDIIDDSMVSASLAAAWNFEFGAMQAATVRAFIDGEAWNEIDTLDKAGLGVQGIYRWQHRLGFTAPFYQLSLAAQQDDSETDFRDANRYTAQAFVTRRLTDALRGSLGVEGSLQEARGRVFDGVQGRLFANGDLQLNADWAVYGTYSLIRGDTVSSAQQQFCNGVLASDTFGLISNAEEIEPDAALTDATCGTWIAYRLPATTHVFVAGINRGFGHSMSFDLSAQQVTVDAKGNNEYHRTIVRAGILARF